MTAETDLLPELVAEGLDFFDLAGDEGDKLYVSAIRQHIAAKDAEIEELRAEVGETKEVAVRAMRQRDAQYNRADQLAQALDMLPIEIYMVEHNPDYGPLMFCCGREVKSRGLNGLIAHSDGCWYKQMCAIRDHYKEGKDG